MAAEILKMATEEPHILRPFCKKMAFVGLSACEIF
jgi:hypothetical protein